MVKEQSVVAAPGISLPRLLAMGIGARLMIDTSVQIFGPFLELIATGMGISIVALGSLNSLRNMMGLTTPAMGVLADRLGYRPVMRALLWVGSLGLLLVGVSNSLWLAALGMMVMGLGCFSFVPVFQAYLSARIPYTRRARALGVVEYSWALSGIFGLSLTGLLISRFGWRAPFLVLGGGLVLVSLFFNTLPASTAVRPPRRGGGIPWRQLPRAFSGFVRFESHGRSVWSAILANALNVFATGHVGIVYGTWLARQYGLSAVELGTAALLFGLTELVGSVLVSIFADRLGKRRSVVLSTAGAVVAYLLLHVLNIGLLPVVVALILTRFTFEVSMVSNISLLSEQVPQERGKVLTLASAGVTTASAISSITGPLAFSQWGVPGLAYPAAVASLIAWVVFMRFVRERDESASPEQGH